VFDPGRRAAIAEGRGGDGAVALDGDLLIGGLERRPILRVDERIGVDPSSIFA
jgi:hypothetical protein